MAAKSKHWADVYVWILEDLIPSCITMEHCDCIRKVIENYTWVYNDTVSNELSRVMDRKYWEIVERKLKGF